MNKTKTKLLIDSVVAVSEKFIKKVDNGRARSKETYKELLALRLQAIELKNILNDE